MKWLLVIWKKKDQTEIKSEKNLQIRKWNHSGLLANNWLFNLENNKQAKIQGWKLKDETIIKWSISLLKESKHQRKNEEKKKLTLQFRRSRSNLKEISN